MENFQLIDANIDGHFLLIMIIIINMVSHFSTYWEHVGTSSRRRNHLQMPSGERKDHSRSNCRKKYHRGGASDESLRSGWGLSILPHVTRVVYRSASGPDTIVQARGILQWQSDRWQTTDSRSPAQIVSPIQTIAIHRLIFLPGLKFFPHHVSFFIIFLYIEKYSFLYVWSLVK